MRQTTPHLEKFPQFQVNQIIFCSNAHRTSISFPSIYLFARLFDRRQDGIIGYRRLGEDCSRLGLEAYVERLHACKCIPDRVSLCNFERSNGVRFERNYW